jgi:hypothetical protein
VTAPSGYRVNLLPPEVVESDLPSATPIRLVADPSAPAYRKIDPDHTHPYRQKEVVKLLKERLSGRKEVTSHDVFCVRKVHGIDGSRSDFYYKSKFASPQYSEAFVNWLAEQYEKDPVFFDKAKKAFKARRAAP